jgi:hypothetical protein
LAGIEIATDWLTELPENLEKPYYETAYIAQIIQN